MSTLVATRVRRDRPGPAFGGPVGRSTLLALLALSGSLSACATAKSGADRALPVTAADYSPLAVGATWTYAVSYPGQKGEMTVRVVGEKDGWLTDDRGSELRHTPDGLRDRQRYLIRHPLEAGASWKTVVSASAVEHNKILSVGERCETTAGPFPDCIVIESSVRRDQNVTLIARFTWAKGVGLVKLETEAEIAGRGRVPQVKQTLLRWSARGDTAARPGEPPPADPEPDEAPDRWER